MIRRIIFSTYLLTLVLIPSCVQFSEKEIFFIPNEYKGTIVIFFEEDHSKQEYDQNNSRIYRIPMNGILKSGFSRAKEVLNQKFYYVDSSQSIVRELNFIIDSSNSHEDFVYGIFDGKMTLNPKVNKDRTSYSNVNSKKTDYIYFTVGTSKDMEQKIIQSHKRIEEVIKKIN